MTRKAPLHPLSKHCLAVSVALQWRYQPGTHELRRPHARNVSSRPLTHALERDDPRANRLLCPPGTNCAHSGTRADHHGFGAVPPLNRSLHGLGNSLGQDLERHLGPLRAKKPEVPHAVVWRMGSHRSTSGLLARRPYGIGGCFPVIAGAIATRFFDVLTARVFQEKKP